MFRLYLFVVRAKRSTVVHLRGDRTEFRSGKKGSAVIMFFIIGALRLGVLPHVFSIEHLYFL